jgi:hypothetical protein
MEVLFLERMATINPMKTRNHTNTNQKNNKDHGIYFFISFWFSRPHAASRM